MDKKILRGKNNPKYLILKDKTFMQKVGKTEVDIKSMSIEEIEELILKGASDV